MIDMPRYWQFAKSFLIPFITSESVNYNMLLIYSFWIWIYIKIYINGWLQMFILYYIGVYSREKMRGKEMI